MQAKKVAKATAAGVIPSLHQEGRRQLPLLLVRIPLVFTIGGNHDGQATGSDQ